MFIGSIRYAAEPSSAWTGEGARPHTGCSAIKTKAASLWLMAES